MTEPHPEPPPPAGAQLSRADFARLDALNFGRNLTAFLLYFKFPLLFGALGFTGGELGWVFMAAPVAALLSTFVLGVLADRVDARAVAAFGLLGFAAHLVGAAHAASPWAFAALFALAGVAGQAFNVGLNAYFLKGLGRTGDETLRMGRWSAAASLGIGTAFLLGPLLVGQIGLIPAMYCTAVVAAGSTALLAGLRPAWASRQDFATYLALGRVPEARVFALAIFLFALHWGAEVTCYSPFLAETLRVPEASLGLFMGPPLFVLAASTLAFGHLGRGTVGPRGLLAAAFLLSGLGGLVFASARAVEVAFLGRLVHEAGDGAFSLFMIWGIQRLFPERMAGGCSGLVWLVAMAAQAVGAAAAGPLGATHGPAFPQQLSSVLALLSLALLPLLGRSR